MDISIEEAQGGVAIIRWGVSTVLDASNAAELRQRLSPVEQTHPKIVLDMSNVEFIDSSIIGALVGLLRRSRQAGGDVKLADITPEVETIFELTRLHTVFRIHESVASAVQDFDRVAPC